MNVVTPASELCPGDILMLSDYAIDLTDVWHTGGMVTLRWSVCEKDVMRVSRTTLFNVLGRLDDN